MGNLCNSAATGPGFEQLHQKEDKVQVNFPFRAGRSASCFPDSWRWSVCKSCCVQPEDIYQDEKNWKPPLGFPGWDVIEKTWKPPSTFIPPQLQADNPSSSDPLSWYQLDWLSHRSLCCVSPTLPCCCFAACNCCFPGLKYVDAADPDQWFATMLSTGSSPAFQQDALGGIYWMDGNYAPEAFMTFQDAYWKSPNLGVKVGGYNWTHDQTCFGSVMGNGTAFPKGALVIRMEISPSGKWIMLNAPDAVESPNKGNTIFMYRLDPGDEFTTKDGSKLQFEPGDYMRLTWTSPLDNASPLAYQYIARRVAHMKGSDLVKTSAYQRYMEQTALHRDTLCCGYGACNMSPQQYLDSFAAQNPKQLVIFAQPPPDAKEMPTQQSMQG